MVYSCSWTEFVRMIAWVLQFTYKLLIMADIVLPDFHCWRKKIYWLIVSGIYWILPVQAARENIPVLVDMEMEGEGFADLLKFADYAVCSEKFPQASLLFILNDWLLSFRMNKNWNPKSAYLLQMSRIYSIDDSPINPRSCSSLWRLRCLFLFSNQFRLFPSPV